jgi:hypothetical protein
MRCDRAIVCHVAVAKESEEKQAPLTRQIQQEESLAWKMTHRLTVGLPGALARAGS